MSTTERVFKFICKYKQGHDGNSPSFRDIARGIGISPKSTSTVVYHLEKLANAGLIELPDGAVKNIVVTGGKWLPPNGETAA